MFSLTSGLLMILIDKEYIFKGLLLQAVSILSPKKSDTWCLQSSEKKITDGVRLFLF